MRSDNSESIFFAQSSSCSVREFGALFDAGLNIRSNPAQMQLAIGNMSMTMRHYGFPASGFRAASQTGTAER
jgi:hypothetical protein